jgi:hypothetical protein
MSSEATEEVKEKKDYGVNTTVINVQSKKIYG